MGGRLGIAWLVGWWVGAGYFVVGKVGWCVPGVRYVLVAGAAGLLPRTCILLGWWQLVVGWLSGESYSENGGCICGGISAPDNYSESCMFGEISTPPQIIPKTAVAFLEEFPRRRDVSLSLSISPVCHLRRLSNAMRPFMSQNGYPQRSSRETSQPTNQPTSLHFGLGPSEVLVRALPSGSN